MTFITSDEQLARVVKRHVREAIREEKERPDPATLYTIGEAAAKLNKAYTTVQRMIRQKRIAATADGRYISQQAIDNYINAE